MQVSLYRQDVIILLTYDCIVIYYYNFSCFSFQVKDVKLITDNKTRRSKGICYVEFQEVASVSLAMGLAGQKLLGVPIIVQQSQAEKNRLAGQTGMGMLKTPNTGPMRLYVGSLHFNITEEMLKGIFEPFGRVCTYIPGC